MEDEGRTGGGEGALLHIDRREDQPVNPTSFFSRTFEDMSRKRLKVRIGSMRVEIIVFEKLFSVTKESYAHFIRHCCTTTQLFCSKEG